MLDKNDFNKCPRPLMNGWIANIPQYVPGKHGKETTEHGPPVILSANENPLGPSQKAIQAIKNNIDNINRYPDGNATILREKIAEKHGLPPDNIICGAGSDELITLLMRSYADKDDEILYSEYGFLMYPITAMSVGASPKIGLDENYKVNIKSILQNITAKTKIIFIANPNNPTGTYLNDDELCEFIAAVPNHILIVLDAAYAEYVDASDYNPGDKYVKNNDNVVMLRTFSKIYGLASLRVGWLYANSFIIDALQRMRSPFNISQIAQIAASAVLDDEDYLARAKKINADNKKFLQQELQKLQLEYIASIGNFLTFALPSPEITKNCIDFLQTKNIYTRGMIAYNMPCHIRVSIGLKEEMQKFIQNLNLFLNQ